MFDPLDFLAEVSAHIPDAHEKTTLFYGWYSNRTRGYRKRHGLVGDVSPADPAADDGAPLEVRRSWARLIRQVYEVDPLVCSRCGGTMRVIAEIEPACADTADRRPAVIQEILTHLGLPSIAPSLRAPPGQSASVAPDQSRARSHKSFFDDLPIPDSLPG